MTLLKEVRRIVWISDLVENTIPNSRTHRWLFLKFGKSLKRFNNYGAGPDSVYKAMRNSGVKIPSVPQSYTKKVKLP